MSEMYAQLINELRRQPRHVHHRPPFTLAPAGPRRRRRRRARRQHR